jgi:hypothetical protein
MAADPRWRAGRIFSSMIPWIRALTVEVFALGFISASYISHLLLHQQRRERAKGVPRTEIMYDLTLYQFVIRHNLFGF